MADQKSITAQVKFKKLTLFVLASSALIATGFISSYSIDEWFLLLLLLYTNLTGVFLVYRLNDCIDQDLELRLNMRNFFAPTLHKLVVVQFILLLIPVSFYFMNPFTVGVLAASGILGVLYSLTFNAAGTQFRIKNLFLIKNIAIGIVWGSLVLIGAGSWKQDVVLCLFVFTSVQVFIGSAIRDVPDLEKDRLNGVKSLPVVLGVGKAITFLHLVNFISILAALICGWDSFWVISLAGIGIYRTINLSLLRAQSDNKLWSQGFNLMTCVLIFLVALGYQYYATL